MSIPSRFSAVLDARAARRRLLSVAFLSLAAIVAGVFPAPARADLLIEVQNTIASAPGTGAFDVTLVDSGGTFNVSGFSIGLSVSPGSGVTFTGVDVSTTTAPYLFGTLQSPPLSFTSFPSTSLIALDTDNTAPFFVTLHTGDVFGLAEVFYKVAAGTSPGPVLVSLNPDPAMTQLDDVTGNLIPFTPINGAITVTPVPEPSALVLAALGATISLACVRHRRPGARVRP